ncbi:MAG: carboxy methyl transferase for protein phosphatase 2A [Icmadophila ericetorum]|nr:carboxy methyl transferase for protein phosphatase 2A [Icmadophila ericetorum]
MSSQQIPNLLSLRNARAGSGRPRGRGGAGFSGSSSVNPEEEAAAKDKVIQQTDQDASVSRMSAVEVGYLDDPFAQEFTAVGGPRRFPIINRGGFLHTSVPLKSIDTKSGTYIRTKAIDRLVDSFLSSEPTRKKQIISLGAGSDTRYFRLMSRAPRPCIIYHEVDFASNARQKISAIRRSTSLSNCIGSPSEVVIEETELDGPSYHIHAIDLRTLPPANSPAAVSMRHVDPSLPTLLLSECCLIYLEPSAADAVVNYFIEHLFPPSTPLGIVLYEPINPFDAFGKVMVSNLAQRGIVLQTLQKYYSLEAQKERLSAHGFSDGQEALDVNTIYEQWVEEHEKERVSSVEMLDEVEEWILLAKHYCVAWGWRKGEDKAGAVWNGWAGDS